MARRRRAAGEEPPRADGPPAPSHFPPLPRPALLVLAALAIAIFALAWVAFRYPLSYCDSPGWAPNYLGELIGRAPPPAASHRAWPATAWFAVLGWLTAKLRFANLIGLVQAAILLAALLPLARRLGARAGVAALLVAPAFLASMLRHAVYSQTILSEPVAIALLAIVAGWLLEPRFGMRTAAGVGAIAALLAAIRADLGYFVPLVLARLLAARGTQPHAAKAAGFAALAMAATLGLVAALAPVGGVRDYPIAKIMTLAEWAPLTDPAPPGARAAAAFRSPLGDRLAEEVAKDSPRTIMEALPAAKLVLKEFPAAGWGDLARVVARDVAQAPARAAADRLAVLRDLFASGYAAFWPGYVPHARFYSPYSAVFTGWTVADLDGGRYGECDYLAAPQRDFFHASGIANEPAANLLFTLHRAAEPLARWVTRPLLWLSLPAFLFVLLRRRADGPLLWLFAILASHFVLRAILICADERYQLPADVLTLGFVAWVFAAATKATSPHR